MALLYANSELFVIEIKKRLTCTISTKAIKNLGVNLTEDVKDLNNENNKILMKETEEDTHMHKKTLFLGRNHFKMFKLPKLVYMFNANTTKLPLMIF